MSSYAAMAAEIVEQALAAGATDAECTISEGDEFSANVRLREVETLKEAGSRGAGLRILRGRHTGSAYTSDLSGEGIRHMVRSAIELAEITTEDPHAGLPEAAELGSIGGDLGMYCGGVEGLAVLDGAWDPGPAPLSAARALVGPGAVARRNRVTLGEHQLRIGRDGRWYPFRKDRTGRWNPDGAPITPVADDEVGTLEDDAGSRWSNS